MGWMSMMVQMIMHMAASMQPCSAQLALQRAAVRARNFPCTPCGGLYTRRAWLSAQHAARAAPGGCGMAHERGTGCTPGSRSQCCEHAGDHACGAARAAPRFLAAPHSAQVRVLWLRCGQLRLAFPARPHMVFSRLACTVLCALLAGQLSLAFAPQHLHRHWTLQLLGYSSRTAHACGWMLLTFVLVLVVRWLFPGREMVVVEIMGNVAAAAMQLQPSRELGKCSASTQRGLAPSADCTGTSSRLVSIEWPRCAGQKTGMRQVHGSAHNGKVATEQRHPLYAALLVGAADETPRVTCSHASLFDLSSSKDESNSSLASSSALGWWSVSRMPQWWLHTYISGCTSPLCPSHRWRRWLWPVFVSHIVRDAPVSLLRGCEVRFSVAPDTG
jgi:hypothetical protein